MTTKFDHEIRTFLTEHFADQLNALSAAEQNDLVYGLACEALDFGDGDDGVDATLAWLEECASLALTSDARAWAKETVRRFADGEALLEAGRRNEALAGKMSKKVN